MDTPPSPEPGNSGNKVLFAILVLPFLAIGILLFGPIILGGGFVLAILLVGAIMELFQPFDELMSEIVGPQVMTFGLGGLAWWATAALAPRAKPYAHLVGLAVSVALAGAIGINLRPTTWWLAIVVPVAGSVLLRQGQTWMAGWLYVAAIALGAAMQYPFWYGKAIGLGNVLAIGGALLTLVMVLRTQKQELPIWLLTTGGYITLIYTHGSTSPPPVLWEPALRPLILATSLFAAIGVLVPRIVFHLGGGKRPAVLNDAFIGAFLALLVVAFIPWQPTGQTSGLTGQGWTLLFVAALLMWTVVKPDTGTAAANALRMLVVVGLLAVLIANPHHPTLDNLAIVFAALAWWRAPWAPVFLAAALASAWGNGGLIAWASVLVGALVCWYPLFVQSVRGRHKSDFFLDWNMPERTSKEEQPMHPYFALAAVAGLTIEVVHTLEALGHLPNIPALPIALAATTVAFLGYQRAKPHIVADILKGNA